MSLIRFNPYEWQLIATALFILLFEVFHIGRKLKRLIYSKERRLDYIRPFDCAFCMHVWVGSISGIYYIFTEQPSSLVIFLGLNIITSKLYDHIFPA